MLEFKFDTQLLIEGHNLSEDAINEYITNNLKGDCLLAVGDEDLIKIHFHTNEPWQLLEYASSLGEFYDIVVENMERQENGLQGLQGQCPCTPDCARCAQGRRGTCGLAAELPPLGDRPRGSQVWCGFLIVE